MFWSKGPDKPPNGEDKAKSTTSSPTSAAGIGSFDENKLPAPRALPEDLKKIIDKDEKEENMFDELVDGYAPDSTQSNIRYAAYTNRIRTVLSSAHRYVAYTSDIGESFRPVAHRNLVRAAYGVSWMYILGDVSYEGYKSYLHNQRALDPTLELTDRQIKISGLEKQSDPAAVVQVPAGKVPPLEDYRTVMVQRAIFQSIASMGLPAFTIHSIVKYSGRSMKDMKSKVIRTWAPIGLGLAIVPFLPMLYDKPVENAVEWMFHKGFKAYGGKSYVGESPVTGREKELIQRPKDL